MTDKITRGLGRNESEEEPELLKVITKPFTELVIQVSDDYNICTWMFRNNSHMLKLFMVVSVVSPIWIHKIALLRRFSLWERSKRVISWKWFSPIKKTVEITTCDCKIGYFMQSRPCSISTDNLLKVMFSKKQDILIYFI